MQSNNLHQAQGRISGETAKSRPRFNGLSGQKSVDCFYLLIQKTFACNSAWDGAGLVKLSEGQHRSALAVEYAQLLLGLLQNALLLLIQIAARAIDVEHQHGHR